MRVSRLSLALLPAVIGLACPAAAGDDVLPASGATTVQLTLKDHRFQPAELHVPAGRPVIVELDNRDDTPEEFESLHLRKERGVKPRSKVRFLIKAQPAGRYAFQGEFHAATAHGTMVFQ